MWSQLAIEISCLKPFSFLGHMENEVWDENQDLRYGINKIQIGHEKFHEKEVVLQPLWNKIRIYWSLKTYIFFESKIGKPFISQRLTLYYINLVDTHYAVINR